VALGADLGAKDGHGVTPLQASVKAGDVAMQAALVELERAACERATAGHRCMRERADRVAAELLDEEQAQEVAATSKVRDTRACGVWGDVKVAELGRHGATETST
jgi:hypothetical protein